MQVEEVEKSDEAPVTRETLHGRPDIYYTLSDPQERHPFKSSHLCLYKVSGSRNVEQWVKHSSSIISLLDLSSESGPVLFCDFEKQQLHLSFGSSSDKWE